MNFNGRERGARLGVSFADTGRQLRARGNWLEAAPSGLAHTSGDRGPRSELLDPAHARGARFDLHAGLVVPARDRLERICRYALRPPIAEDRIRLTEAGHVRLQFRRRWSDGTSYVRFDPVELLERLAAITPRPRVNLILYYEVLGARAGWRTQVVPHGGTTSDERADRGRPDAPQFRV
jgi:hypothetical protein